MNASTLVDGPTTPPHGAFPCRGDAVPPRGGRILVIAGRESDRSALAAALADTGEVTCGDAAALEAQPFDLCVVDAEALDSLAAALVARRPPTGPRFLSCLLVTPPERVGAVCHHVGALADEILVVPASPQAIAARVEALLSRRRNQLRLRVQATAIEAAANAIVITDASGVLVWANPAFTALSGHSAADAEGTQAGALLRSGLQDRRFYQHLWRTIGDGQVWRGELVNRRKDGSVYTEEQTITPVRDAAGTITHHVAVKQDVSRRKQDEARLEQHVDRLRALRAIDTAVASSLDLGLTLHVLLDHTVRHLRADAGAVLVRRTDSQQVECVAWRGFRSAALGRARLRLGEGHAGRVMVDRKLVSVPDLRAAPDSASRAGLLGSERFVAYYGVPLLAKGQVCGVLELFHRTPLPLAEDATEFLRAVANQASVAIDDARLFENLQRSNTDLRLAYDITLEGWARALDLRDKETEGHTRRVTDLTVRLAQRLGLPDSDIVHVRRGAVLHDIGKLGVPDAILLKPGPLTDAEWDVMRKHPVWAYEWLSSITFLRPALEIPYCHHERWDGTGYPRQLKAEDIPLGARIFAVADVFDGLTSDRPYRRGWTRERAIAYIKEQSGRHFDPRVVEAFVAMVGA